MNISILLKTILVRRIHFKLDILQIVILFLTLRIETNILYVSRMQNMVKFRNLYQQQHQNYFLKISLYLNKIFTF